MVTKQFRQPPKDQLAAGDVPHFFLRTKLLPPRPAPALLHRPRLTERLLANLSSPVTLVTANAGSGKTTLVADFVRTNAPRFVWYQLDHTDADPSVFLSYLAHGIRQAVPDFGDVVLSYLQQAAGELARQPERGIDVLLNQVLDKVEQQLIIVLDDYHHLGKETAVHRMVDRLLSYLPDVLHIIIVARDIPPLGLARLRSQTSLAIIDRAELLFTDEETQALFRQTFDLELTREQLTEYRERTHGWITALQLVRQVAQRQALSRPETTPDLAEVLRQSERDIFEYFAEEVFADESPEVQNFLLRIALLDRIEMELCVALYPEVNSAMLLPALVRRNVFLTVASDERGEEYRLHPLFRSFLERRLQAEIGHDALLTERARLVDYYLQHERWELALRHLLLIKDEDRAAAVIAEKGNFWIETGALLSLASFTESLPQSALIKHPRALSYRAEVFRLQGDYQKAQTLFRQAAKNLRANNDSEGEAEALHSLATIARRRGELTTAFSLLDRAAALIGENSPVRIKCGNTRGLCLHAGGDWVGAEAEFRLALQLAEEQGDEHHARLIAHNLGLPAMVRGDFGEALRWLQRMFRPADQGRAFPPLPQEATALLNMARCSLYRGELANCEKQLDGALERCQLYHLAALRGEVFETYGNLYRESGQSPRAVEFYERAARAYADAGVELSQHELLEEQALLYLQLGETSRATALLNKLIDERQKSGGGVGAYTAQLARARVLLSERKMSEAEAELRPALAYFREHQLHYYEAQASLALAACAETRGDQSGMVENLRRVLDLAARYDYDYWLKNEAESNRRLFAAPAALELLPPEIRELMVSSAASMTQDQESVGEERRTLPVAVTAEPAIDLTINMLGPVEIYRDPARPLAADAWVTKRARDIICFIASRAHHRASKDTIIDTFWGEADPALIEKNFHPTISHIRKALNSNQSLKQNFLLYRDGDYILPPDFSYRFDHEDFDRLVREGETARRAGQTEQYTALYEAAAALYRGDFMQNCFDEWVDEQRSYYQEQYLRILEALTNAAQKAADWDRVTTLAQKILRVDPFREDIHGLQMRAAAAVNNRAAVKEHYEGLKRLLRKELGVEPAPETQRLYRELMK